MAAVGGIAGARGAVLGNATSILGATLATDVADPLDRLRRISASTQTAKVLHQALGDRMVMRAADALPPGILGAAMRAYGATGLPSCPPPFNAVISNVPGPPVRLHSSGARVVSCYLFGPLVQSVALDITVISYAGSSTSASPPVPTSSRTRGRSPTRCRRRWSPWSTPWRGGPRGVTSAQRGGGHRPR